MTDKPVITAQRRALALGEIELTCIRIDHQAHLQFGEVGVVIGCPFELTVDGVEYRLDPEVRRDLGPLLALYPTSLSAAQVSVKATLTLDFDRGARLVVPAHDHYEAWQVHDANGWLLVCLPGTSGETAEWPRP